MSARSTTAGQLLRAYDDHLREEAELLNARAAERRGPVWWAEFPSGGFVTYRDLGGLEGSALDGLIAETVAHFRDGTDLDRFEWKTRGHDEPRDLGERLVAGGLVAEEVETVMIGEAVALARGLQAAAVPGVVVRRAGEGGGLRDDLARIQAMQDEVFGPGRGPGVDEALRELAGGDAEYWLAEADGGSGPMVVSAGRLVVVRGSGFAGIWGGGTLPRWRGRGIYRALVAARAGSAAARGVRWIHSDCTAMSRPILERSGLVAVTSTTPYVWTR